MSEKNLTEKKADAKYYGTIVSVPKGENFCFVGIQSITEETSGTPADLKTTEDIFLHQDDCADPLRVGMFVEFYAVEDRHRGAGHYRAFGAMEIAEGELIPSDESPIPGFYAMTRASEDGTMVPIAPRTNYHVGAKIVPTEAVNQVTKNDPMPGIPRGCFNYTDEEKLRLLSAMLAAFFPSLALFSADYDILDMSDDELDKAVRENEPDLQALGMPQQIEEIRKEAKRFKEMKATLKLMFDDGLVRPDTIIPIRYLPDLFMAVPVWYFWAPPNEVGNIESVWQASDPHPQEEIKYFCNLFPHQIWAHTYQMFNRRMRSFRMYNGDKMPPFVSRRLIKAVKAFDYVVIATPYHQEAGKDWQDLNWLHLIDPYVLGFKKDVPYFFVLARFSDSGTFPLYPEMVADTIGFLGSNIEKLSGFDLVNMPFWCVPSGTENIWRAQLGTDLKKHTKELICHFDDGTLFAWLRGDAGKIDFDKK
ncbi:MAG: hypothetical protein WA064_00970 [Candidatus Moraniibacteriota bacterium]